MNCKFCHQDKKLIKAHIIPEYFYRQLKEDAPHIVEVYSERHNKGRSLIGHYDTNLLCRECEDKFCQWDDAGIRFFQRAQQWERVAAKHLGQDVACYIASNFDYS